MGVSGRLSAQGKQVEENIEKVSTHLPRINLPSGNTAGKERRTESHIFFFMFNKIQKDLPDLWSAIVHCADFTA